jgi:hypothetical protein
MKESQTKRFCRCIKKVRKTLKARKGQSKESGAIGVCVKSVLQRKLAPTGRTLFKFHCKTRRGKKGRVVTQPMRQKGGKHYTIREDPCKGSPVKLTSVPTGKEDSITYHKDGRDHVLKPGDHVLSIALQDILRKRPRRIRSGSKSRSASASMSNLIFVDAHYKTLHIPTLHKRSSLDDYQITKLEFEVDKNPVFIHCEDFKEFIDKIVPL